MATTTSKRVEQGDATRSALLAVARRLFGTRGYAATSLQGIVESAGVTKGAFYHHFATKQELFLAVFEQVQREIGREAFVVHLDHEHPDVSPDAPGPAVRDLSAETNEQVWDHLLVGCRTYLELHARPDVQRIVLIDGRAILPWTDWHRIHADHGVTLLRADLRRARNRRLIRDLPLATVATLLAGALHEACILIAHADDVEAAITASMAVVAHFLHGLRADASELAGGGAGGPT